MTGGLVKRGRIWYARIWYQGKEIKKSTGEKNKAKAQVKLAKMIAPLNASDSAGAHLEAIKLLVTDEQEQRGAITPLSALWDIFESAPERPDCSSRTIDDYRLAVIRFVKWSTTLPRPITTLSQVTTFTASQYCKNLGRIVGNSTYNKHLGILRLTWKSIVRQTGWDSNPWNNISRKRYEAVSKEELSKIQIKALLANSTGELKYLFMLGVYTGQRKKDLCLLEWKKVSLEKKRIWLKPAKTVLRKNTIVTVPIHDAIVPILRRRRTSKYVLPEIADKYLHHYKKLNREIATVFDNAGIKRLADSTPSTHKKRPVLFGFHSLRHTFVSMCKENGVPDSVAQALVGHSSPAMTRIYTHTGDKALFDAITGIKVLK